MTWTCPSCSKVLDALEGIGGHIRRCDITEAQLFWSRVSKEGHNGCWIWEGKKQKPFGHGVVTRGRNWKRYYTLAHRYAWELEGRTIPKGAFLLHTCDNPPCVNLDHLWVGTHEDNIADMAAKGRRAWGEQTNCNKMTKAQAEDVLREYWFDPAHRTSNVHELAARYSVLPGAITNIIAGRSWKGLDRSIRAVSTCRKTP